MVRWSYGITTVSERRFNLLQDTLQSLASSGFPNPKVFTDGLPHKLGHLANWMRTAFNLYTMEPLADRYAIFEDDLICCSNLREYLEQWHPDPGYLNLLTHQQNADLLQPRAPHGWYLSNQRGRGAVALVFDNSAIRDLLTSRVFIDRPKMEHKQSADSIVLESLGPYGYKEYFHHPGLVQHMGKESMLGHQYGEMESFGGTSYDPLTIGACA